jgi:WD40 repeat protein
MKDLFPENYFVDGGTLRPDTPSYVERPADDELFKALLAGEYCYVLTPRQMGKSSLMIHTSQLLKERNVKTAIVDIQRIGTNKVKEWYGSMLSQIRRGLGLKMDTDEWMRQKSNIGYGELFVQFIQDVVLTQIENPVVIFFDEVDWMIKLDFRDDFFASIRAIYNARAQYLELSRISFVLLGVAAPADLIAEPTRTPFNIGHAIPLQELSFDDADPLQEGLDAIYPGNGRRILERIFYWTDGHPYLTQKICKAIAEDTKANWSNDAIDNLVRELFLSEESRKEANLKFIQDRVLSNEQYGELLKFYKRSLKSRIRDNGQSIVQNQLMLSGLLTSEDGYVKVRNRIYRTVFDEKWIRQHMPRDWQRLVIIVLGVLLGVMISAFTIVYFSDSSKADQIRQYQLDFNAAYNTNNKKPPEEQLAILANILRTDGVLLDLDEDDIVRNLFFNNLRTWEDQKALFIYPDNVLNENSQLQEDLTVVISRIYYSLAMTNPEDDNTELLEVMLDALKDKDSLLYKELDNWIKARKQVLLVRERQNDNDPSNDGMVDDYYNRALQNYTLAIKFNEENPALYYERALVYINLKSLQDQLLALSDLDKVVSIAGASYPRNPSTPITPSPTRTAEVIATEAVVSNVLVTNSPTSIPLEKGTPSITETSIPGRTRTPSPTLNPTQRTQVALTASPTRPATFTPVPSATPTPPPILLSTPTLSPTPDKVGPGFYKGEGVYFDILGEVQRVLSSNPWLDNLLTTNRDYFPHLRDANLVKAYPSFTPTYTLTPTITPEPKGLASQNLTTISSSNVGEIRVVEQLGKGIAVQAAYSPDGTTLAVASSRGIYFYDVTNLQQTGFIPTDYLVTKMAFSPDGTILAAALADDNIYFWLVASRERRGNVLVGHSGTITALAFSPDGTILASGSEDTTVRLWQISTGRSLPSFVEETPNTETIRSVAFSPDGQLFAYGSDDETSRIWRMSDRSLYSSTYGSTVAFFPDGQRIITSSNNFVFIQNLADSSILYQDNLDGGSDIIISPNGRTVALISVDGTIHLWQVEGNELTSPHTLAGDNPVTSISFSVNAQNLVSTATDSTISLWRVGTGELLQVLDDHVSSTYIALSRDSSLLAAGLPDGRVNIWSLDKGEIIETLQGGGGLISSLAFSPDGETVAAGTEDGSVILWSVADGSLIQSVTDHEDVVWSVAYSPDGSYLISGSGDGTLRLWYLGGQAGIQPAQELPYGEIVYGVTYCNNGMVVFGLGDSTVRAVSSTLNRELAGHTDDVRSVACSSRGNMLASGSADNSIRLWSLGDVISSKTLIGHTDTVTSVAFSPEGILLASGSDDGTVRVWDVEGGTRLQTLTDHRDAISSLAFSLDGKFIVSSSLDGTIDIWGIL